MPIQPVYYKNHLSKKCPVKEYFGSFSALPADSEDVKSRKLSILAAIDRKIWKVAENDGRPTPPISKALKRFGVIETRPKR